MILENTNFVVGIAFALFLLVLWRFDVPGILGRALDKRAVRIREELDEARRLREDAQSLLAAYERKQKEAEGQVQDIVAHARTQAEEAAEAAKRDLDVAIARRIRSAQEQLASAETAAVREVRNEAARVAILAAQDVIAGQLSEAGRDKLIDDGIAVIGAKLH